MSKDHPFKSRAGRNFKRAGLLILTLLVGCSSQSAKQGGKAGSDPGPTPSQSSTTTPVPEAALAPALLVKHPLQAAQLSIHVGKTGTLARLGHNHLITASLIGATWLDTTGALHATASANVDDLVVDDPEQRASRVAAGNPDYASVPSSKNTRDTRANMLGTKVLDAARFPLINATARVPAAAAEFQNSNTGSLNATFNLSLRGTVHTQPVTLDWHRNAGRIVWAATFTVNHQQFGMTPFSALGGALRVAEDLRIELQGSLADPFSLGSE